VRSISPIVGWILLTPILVLVLGCGQEEPERTPVRGRVTYKGTPLRGGTIVFAPDRDRGGSGPIATASIQSDGTYVLRTGDANGVTPGWHRITITGTDSPGMPSALPHSYSESMPCLCREVLPGQENVIDLHLD